MEVTINVDGSYTSKLFVRCNDNLGGWFKINHKNLELSELEWFDIIAKCPIQLSTIPKKYRTTELLLHYKLRWK